MGQVTFDEEKVPDATWKKKQNIPIQLSKMTAFLIERGWVKNESQANMALIAATILAVFLAGAIAFKGTKGPVHHNVQNIPFNQI